MKRPTTTTELRYPGPGHVLRYVRLAVERTGPDLVEGLMPALDDLCDGTSGDGGGDQRGVRLGALAMLIDYAAGSLAMEAIAPDWPVTHDLAVHLLQPAPPEGELASTSRMVRAGRNSVISETEVVSPVVGPVARAYVTFTRVLRRADTPTASSSLDVMNLAEPLERERPRVPLDQAVGFRLEVGDEAERGDGAHPGTGAHVEFDHSPFVVNSLGAIQGGVVALALERAVSWAAERCLGVRCRTTDLHLHYLSLGKDGPFQARAEVLRVEDAGDGDGGVVARVALHDTGNDDKLLALGVGTATTSFAGSIRGPASQGTGSLRLG